MSERNMSKNHISKDKIPTKDIRKNATTKDKAQKPAEKGEKLSGKSSLVMYRILAALWMVLCAALLVRVWSLNHTVESLKDKIGSLTRISMEQQGRLEKLAETSDTGPGSSLRQGDEPEYRDVGRAGAESQGRIQADGQENGPQNQNPQAEAAAVNGQGIAGTAGQGAAHKVYLTFDDGPSANTQDILDILDRYGVKATFFVVGREGSQAEETLRAIVEAGHTLGMHSYTHKYDEIYASVENFAADFERERAYLLDVTGVESTIYRFPGGSSNTVSETDMREFAEYLDSQGVRFFDWNISSGDGGSFLVPVEMLIENCTAAIKDHSTSVVLMHDAAGKTTTREALPTIIETIQAMDDTVLLPITEETMPVQHIQWKEEK